MNVELEEKRTQIILSRRTWLLGSVASLAGLARPARADDPFEKIKARGRAAGMDLFDTSETTNYRGIGDAPLRTINEALKVSEAMAKDFRAHFKEKGFDLVWPKEKMVIVILASGQSYAAFEGGFVDEAIGGHFDLKENWLVSFDYRKRDPRSTAVVLHPEEANTLTLAHEMMHQLTFNTGMLDLKSDVPLLVSEGLATYGETWRMLNVKGGVIGSERSLRPLGLELGKKQGVGWIPIAQLLVDDNLFTDEKTQQVAYAECWKMTHKLLKDSTRRPQYRSYLEALKSNADPKQRLAIASEYLRDLDKLDTWVKSSR